MKNIYEAIEELKAEMNSNAIDFTDNYYDCGSRYLCDDISEFADSRTSVYYNDIIKFISENVEAVNEAIEEFGWEGCGGDLYKAGQMAEFMQIQNEINEDFENVLKLAMLKTIRDKDIIEMDEEMLEDWLNEITNFYSDDAFKDISIMVYDFLAEFEEQCEDKPELEKLIVKIA